MMAFQTSVRYTACKGRTLMTATTETETARPGRKRGEPKRAVTTHLPPALCARVFQAADAAGKSVSAWIADQLQPALSGEERAS
jgi:predicted HicB family RNase H-like nuclease